jgi:MFS family permease
VGARANVIATTSGVLGGWLAIMPPTVVTLALRLREFDSSGLPVVYSVILAAGWAAMIVALIGFGRLGDLVRERTGSRALLARIGAPLMLVTGVVLALAPSPEWLLVAWVVAQAPSAMVITTALAEAGDVVPSRNRGLTSGLIGAAPIVALFLGSAVVTGLSSALPVAFLVSSGIGAALALPLALVRMPPPDVTAPPRAPLPTSPAHAHLLPSRIWVAFLLGSFLLSWATSTANGFLVPYVQNVTDVADDELTRLSTSGVLLAALLATTSGIVGGLLAGGRRRGAWMWSFAALACSVGLIVILTSPTATGVLVTAAVFGAGFGLANGVELGIVLMLRTDPARLGLDLGVFTAVTALPYVLVPALATLLLAGSTASGLVQLFALALVLALASAILVGGIARRLPRTPQRSTAPQA